jgi:hypothetical protein
MSMSFQPVILIIVVTIGFLLVWWLDPTLRWLREFKAELKARKSLADDEFYEKFFANQSIPAHIPIRLRQTFANHMAYPAEKLLPDDDLSTYWHDLDAADIIREIQVECGVTFTDADLEQIRVVSIRELTKCILEKQANTACRQSPADGRG